jgi:hypothetical protein
VKDENGLWIVAPKLGTIVDSGDNSIVTALTEPVTQPSNDTAVPSSNYVRAFDPTHENVSVNAIQSGVGAVETQPMLPLGVPMVVPVKESQPTMILIGIGLAFFVFKFLKK